MTKCNGNRQTWTDEEAVLFLNIINETNEIIQTLLFPIIMAYWDTSMSMFVVTCTMTAQHVKWKLLNK